MLITIDVGNTDIVMIVYDKNEEIIFKDRRSIKIDNFDDYLKEIIKEDYLKFDYIVSCVVFGIIDKLKLSLNKFFNKDGYFVDYNSYPSMLTKLKNPKEIGSDLLAASVYAKELSNDPSIIVDMGSANKIIYVKDGLIEGVSIMLGVKNNMLALNREIKHLPKIDLKFYDNLLGNDTITALSSGLMYGTLYAIEGIVLALEENENIKVKKILTGGISNIFKEKMSDFTMINDLVNRGLLSIYKQSEKNYVK